MYKAYSVHVCLHGAGSHEQSGMLEVSAGLGRVRVRSAGSAGVEMCGKGEGEGKAQGKVKEENGGAATGGGADGGGQMGSAKIRD